jgi:hypothetical protein
MRPIEQGAFSVQSNQDEQLERHWQQVQVDVVREFFRTEHLHVAQLKFVESRWAAIPRFGSSLKQQAYELV